VEELRNRPAFFGALGARECLIDRDEPVGDLSGTAQGFRHLTQERDMPKGGIVLAEFVEAGAQQPQSAGDIAAPDRA
jgi:hypothetical protein